MMPRMKGVSRYIAKQIAVVALFVTFALTAAVWLSQSLRFVDMIINHGLPLGLSLYFLALMMPSLLVLVLPVSLFIAVIFVYHKLITDSELVVMRAAGMSSMAIARPAVALTALVTLIGFALTLYFLPASYRAFRDLQHTIRNNHAQVVLQEGVFTDFADGLTFFARARDPDGVLRGVLVHDSRMPERPITYTATRGTIVTGNTGPRIVLEDGTYQEGRRLDGDLSILYFDRAVVDLAELLPPGNGRSRKAKERYLRELFFPADVNDQAERARLRAAGHQRLVTPLYCFAFTIVGLAFLLSGDFQRRGHFARIVAAVLAIVALQVLSLGLEFLAANLPITAPLMYAGPVLPALVGCFVLLQPTGRRRPAAARGAQ